MLMHSAQKSRTIAENCGNLVNEIISNKIKPIVNMAAQAGLFECVIPMRELNGEFAGTPLTQKIIQSLEDHGYTCSLTPEVVHGRFGCCVMDYLKIKW